MDNTNKKSPVNITERKFNRLLSRRTQKLLSITAILAECKSPDRFMRRPFLAELLSQSMQIEEYLDAYGAPNNRHWRPLRSLVATTKLFSDVSYELLHIKHQIPSYHLHLIQQDFLKATQETCEFTGNILLQASRQIVALASYLELPVKKEPDAIERYGEELPPGKLPRDSGARRVETASDTIIRLATVSLNLASESTVLHGSQEDNWNERFNYTPQSFTEENLRLLELRFHNLQSLYDTHISGTGTEEIDADLPVLRGHISVIFHLLRTATAFAHYYERHLLAAMPRTTRSRGRAAEPVLHSVVKKQELLNALMQYSLAYSSRFLAGIRNLCQSMLKRYTIVTEIELPVPPYRGFHVRPATLISRLVNHYGTSVRMELDNERYDASLPLELFRANEKINAQKRRSIASEIVRLQMASGEAKNKDFERVVRGVVLMLAERSKVVIYEQPLKLPEIAAAQEGTLLERVIAEINRLFATGKIDFTADMKVKFIGGSQVLKDIELLAKAGYGEDNFGNNIALPKQLTYLRK